MYKNSTPPPPLGLILLSLCSSLPSPADPPQLFLFALPHSLLHHGPASQPQPTVCILSEGIHTDTERGFGRQHPTDISLVLGGSLTDQGGVVDEAVLWSVMFGLQCSAYQERGTGIITVRFTQAKQRKRCIPRVWCTLKRKVASYVRECLSTYSPCAIC